MDVVYFLMFPGWADELPANRWHFARRWAQRKPVVLVQPTLNRGGTKARASVEERIPNCEILTLRAFRADAVLESGAIQIAQVLDHMASRGYRRPLLWCYNPNLLALYAGLPAVCRIVHATENYFHFADLEDWFYLRLRTACAISDAVIAVSHGIRDTIAAETGVEAHVITNGCDFAFYSAATPDRELAGVASGYERVAVYAGNVNGRLDFDLLSRTVATYPSTLFAFYGPIAGLGAGDVVRWKQMLRQPNVEYLGPVEASRLPNLYAAADVGIIPYRRERLLVENGFPLKTLEMAATGLPIVSSLMKPIVGLADAVRVASTDDEFLAAVGQVSRRSLTEAQSRELVDVSCTNDYDVKFEAVNALVAEHLRVPREPETRIDRSIELIGLDGWHAVCDSWRRREAAASSWRLRLFSIIAALLPTWARRRIPRKAKSWVRSRLRVPASTAGPDHRAQDAH